MSVSEEQDLPHTHLQFIGDLPWNKYLWLMTRVFVAELLGSALFILPVNIIPSPTGYEPLMVGMAMGGVFWVALWIIYPVSGGHINPIISLTSFLQQNINLSHLLVYWFAQFAGAFLAMIIGLKITPLGQNGTKLHLTQPLPSVSEGHAFVVELITGCILVIVYLSTIDLKRPKNWGLSTGLNMALPLMFAVIGIVIISDTTTKGCANPFRSLPVAIWNKEYKHLWIYLAGSPIGAVIGIFLHMLFLSASSDDK
nr:Aquaporin [Hymenolepis microstoma]